MSWIRFYTLRRKCPICGKPDGCSISEDGQIVMCARIPSDQQRGEPFAGGWLHQLNEPIPKIHIPKTSRGVSSSVMGTLAARYIMNINGHLEALAKEVGVRVSSLKSLDVGWDGQSVSFPMRDGLRNIIGIRLRGKRKYCVQGSKAGLFWPSTVHVDSSLLLLPEGPTDTAALMDMGFAAIGRPSCSAGANHIIDILKQCRRPVVIVADNDEVKMRPDGSMWYPGWDGAKRLAQKIKAFCNGVKIIKPPNYKDVREWYKHEATYESVMCLINNAKGYHL